MRLECRQWMRWVVCYSRWSSKLTVSPTLPITLFSLPIQKVPFVFHWPLMHDNDGCMENLDGFNIIFSLMLHVVQVEKCLMHGDKLLIKAPHGFSQCRYFTKYDYLIFFKIYLCRSCFLDLYMELLNWLPCNLEFIFHLPILSHEILHIWLGSACKGQVGCSNGLWISPGICYNPLSLMNAGDVR